MMEWGRNGPLRPCDGLLASPSPFADTLKRSSQTEKLLMRERLTQETMVASSLALANV